ncbi:uncharacterized protein LOC104903214 [Beta vulgaris subsp. vulgaris]|uniref:uncharacterized protein LOC104903214 n=1 Tax=Beta vulgaris subsp. vulgaris TaxID=3555 RepID=UPI0020373A09|nr:uncharacterized protein LOC104903214 [Beta vulgaris subsp. vulgaris]
MSASLLPGHENNNLAAAIRLLAEKLTQERAERPDTIGDMFERLDKIKPPYYKGQADPTFLENWIREFRKFGVVNCPENMRVGQAILYLKDEADLWWRGNEARLSVVEGFNWDAFVIALRGKFYPAFMRKQKAHEFINLRMGSMTISEYYSKFIALSRFAPKVVAIEEWKAQRFEQGLTDEIQLGLGGETFTSIDIVYGIAAHIYGLQSRRDKKNVVVGEKRKDFAGGNQGNFKKNRNGNGNFQGRSNQDNRNRGRAERVYQCKKCNNNHPGRDCKGDQSTNQVSKPVGLQNSQGNYSKPASENLYENKTASKLYVMSRNEADKSIDVVSDRFSINSVLVKTLFDSGATYSFVSSSVLKNLGLVDYEEIDLSISIPTREIIRCTKLFINLPLKIGECVFSSDLIEFTLGDLDVILGMS